jgi:hypothetical protein
MVTNRNQHSPETRAAQASNEAGLQSNKIGAPTPYDFAAKNLTPYGGLLPVATMLERIGFQQLVEQRLTMERMHKVMSPYQFVLAIVIGIFVGFVLLNQLRYIARDPLVRESWKRRTCRRDARSGVFSIFALRHSASDPVDSATNAGTALGRSQYLT